MTMTDVAETSKPAADTDKFRLLHTMIRAATSMHRCSSIPTCLV
jgi:hypothetical protein